MTSYLLPPGKSPEFDVDDLEWAMGELLHMIWQAKRAGMLPQEFNPLLSYRCMQVIECQPRVVAEYCVKVLNDTKPGVAWIRPGMLKPCS